MFGRATTPFTRVGLLPARTGADAGILTPLQETGLCSPPFSSLDARHGVPASSSLHFSLCSAHRPRSRRLASREPSLTPPVDSQLPAFPSSCQARRSAE